MKKENSDKAQSGIKSKKALEAALEYLKSVNLVVEYYPKKFGYAQKRKDQFNCDFVVKLSNNERGILFSPNSFSTDRLKTKQWDAEHIKIIDPTIKWAYIVFPDTTANKKSIVRYKEFILSGIDVSAIDNIFLQSEFISHIENTLLGNKLAGRKAAKAGNDFETLFARIMDNKYNLERWKGDKTSSGIHYPLFEKVVNFLSLYPKEVVSISADDNIPDLPTYVYKDGTTKPGGHPKTDVCLTVKFKKNRIEEYRFSCKNPSKNLVTVFQFPPKYCAEIMGITDMRFEQLLNEYVSSGGPTKFPEQKAKLLTSILKPYLDEFNLWCLHGSSKDKSTERQRADYILVRKNTKNGPEIYLRSVENCIKEQNSIGKGHFGTAFSWSVTSSKEKKDGTKTIYPAMRIYVK